MAPLLALLTLLLLPPSLSLLRLPAAFHGPRCPHRPHLERHPDPGRAPGIALFAETESPPSSPQALAFDLPAYLSLHLPSVTSALETSLADQTVPETSTITSAMLYSLLAGGKRIRPMLCLLTADAFLRPHAAVLPLAVAVEMVHTMSLIHDDLPAMDDDDYRRGKPTCHKVYGEDVAILAGDALLSTAFAVLAKRTPRGEIGGEEGGREGRLLDAVVRLGEAVSATGLAGGQVMDLQCEGRPSAEVSVDDLKWIHTHKTAKLLNICVAASAVLSGASPPQVRSLELFADKVGLAFQVADDILDVTASSDALGKTAGKDEATDKATYVRKLGLDGAREEAERLVREAKGHLDELGFGGRVDGLKAIADFIIDRKN
ncbi:hypothetical protein TeGR_g6700 [Tetraparma gracilis]|uniref:Geranylgeranyl diphosphate synthase n=1 Tax=Tetraparma gracilis TaxID=2962635 RepID=A0ABQ6MYQ6_9STRA|nr:hypothetical protein TeGR_g6700 [Tetraparma gracilis]